MSERPQASGLGHVQKSVLTAIVKLGGSATRAELQAATRMRSLPGLYESLRRLEERGLIVRERHPRPQPTVYKLKESA